MRSNIVEDGAFNNFEIRSKYGNSFIYRATYIFLERENTLVLNCPVTKTKGGDNTVIIKRF